MGRSNPFFIVVPVNPEHNPTAAPGVQALANRALASLDRDHASTEARRFLEFVADGSGIECGHKGQLLTWGYVSNYGEASRTVQDLRTFWEGLWLLEDGPLPHETALVFSQDEESSPKAIQVGVDTDALEDRREVVIRTKASWLEVGLLGQL